MGPTAPCRSEGRRLQISHKTGSSRGHLLSARPGQCTSPPCWEPPAGASHGRARGILALTPVASVASHLFRLFCTSVGSLRPQDPHGSWVPRSIATGQGVRVQGRAVWPSSRLLLELLLGGVFSGPVTHPGTWLTIRPARFWLSAHPATGRNHQGQVHTTGPFPPPSHFSTALTHLFLSCYP